MNGILLHVTTQPALCYVTIMRYTVLVIKLSITEMQLSNITLILPICCVYLHYQIPLKLKCFGADILGPKFIDTILSRVTLPGSIFLAIIAVLPAFAMLGGVEANFSQFYGGTSLLIMVGVILDTLQQIESYLLMRHYEGMMSSGRIKGRTAAA